MPGLTKASREEIRQLLRDELKMVEEKAVYMASQFWGHAERRVAEERGYGDTLVRIAALKEEIESLQRQLNELESTLLEKSRMATSEDYSTVDIDVAADRYGNVPDYYRPVIFKRKIVTYWDVLVLAYLNRSLPFMQVYKNLQHLNHSVLRDLMFCGTYEDARELYFKFKQKIVEAMGNDLPELVAEVKAIPALRGPDDEEMEG